MINVEAITEIAEQRRERNVQMQTRYFGELIAAQSVGVDISAIITSERFRTALPHEVARGARRLLPHETLGGLAEIEEERERFARDKRKKSIQFVEGLAEGISPEFRTDASKPVVNELIIRKRMGGFTG